MFELFSHINFNRIQQGYSKLKKSVEFHSLENQSQSKLSYSKYIVQMHHLLRQVMQKGPKLKASIAVCNTEIKDEKEISCE